MRCSELKASSEALHCTEERLWTAWSLTRFLLFIGVSRLVHSYPGSYCVVLDLNPDVHEFELLQRWFRTRPESKPSKV
jgi:hypothetical protein